MENHLPGVIAWIAQWSSHWSSMGGYAAFVWPAYAVAAIVLGGLSWQSWRAHRISGRTLDRLTRRADDGGGRRR